MDEEQLNYLLRTGYIPSDRGFQIGQFGPNQNYLGKSMQGLESLGIGPNLNYLGDGTMTGSIGVGPNQNYLGKGMQIGSMGQPRYDSGTQTIFPSNISPALSDLGGITPSYGVANEADDEQDQEYIDQVEKSNNPLSGILDLLRNIPTPFNLVRRGLESLSKFTPSAPKYIGTDFFNPATGLNRFDRAAERYKRTGSVKDLFASSRSGAEFFRKLRERKAAKQKAFEDAAKKKRDFDPGSGGGDNRPSFTGTGDFATFDTSGKDYGPFSR